MPQAISSLLLRRVLVLDKSWSPFNEISTKRALSLLFSSPHKALYVNPTDLSLYSRTSPWAVAPLTSAHHVLSTANFAFRAPDAIILPHYSSATPPRHAHRFSRHAVLLRDRATCQYCGLPAQTVDHVVPKARGGTSVWENVVACCRACNCRKGKTLLRDAGLRLRKNARLVQPTAAEMRSLKRKRLYTCWADLLAKHQGDSGHVHVGDSSAAEVG